MTINFTSKFVSANGKRARVSYTTGPWITGVDPTTIKVRPWVGGAFPAEIRAAAAAFIENNSDMREDYFEKDCIRVYEGHPLYSAVKQAASFG